MTPVSQFGPALKVESSFSAPEIRWLDAATPCFRLYGLTRDENGYKRMDSQVAAAVSEDVLSLHRHTSGGRLTFETDSDYMAINVKTRPAQTSTMPATTVSGFDVYLVREDGMEFVNIFKPPVDFTDGYQDIFYFREKGPHRVVLHFPLDNAVEALSIGLRQTANICPYTPYPAQPPIVFYGSSITQGACASRPGNSYCSMVAQKLRRDYLCLGFSGSAHGEEAMAEYIASLPMSALVLDYDHNDCDNLAAFSQRHPRCYQIIREKHPHLPILIMSAPYAAKTFYESHPANSLAIIKKTYRQAKAKGDRVAFLNTCALFRDFRDAALTDRIHPGDFGHVLMAKGVLRALARILL